jgi:hypothetical protein
LQKKRKGAFHMSSKRTVRMHLFVVAMFVLGPMFALATASSGERVDSGVQGMTWEHNTRVTMTDGLQLRVNIYSPDKPGRFPVLLLMGPYGKDTPYADAPAYKPSWSKLLAKYPDLCKKSSCRYLRFEAPSTKNGWPIPAALWFHFYALETGRAGAFMAMLRRQARRSGCASKRAII